MNEYKNWFRLVSRSAAVLPAQNIMMGYVISSFEKEVKIDCKFSGFRYINNGAYVYKKEFFSFVEKVQEKVKKNPDYINWLIEKNYLQCEKLLKNVRMIDDDLGVRSNNELKKQLLKYVSEFCKMGPFWAAPFAVEKIGSEIIMSELKEKLPSSDESKIKDYFLTLTAPEKEGYIGEEQRNFLKIAIEIQNQGYILSDSDLALRLEKKDAIWKKIVDHVRKFEWLNIQYMIGDPWTMKDFFIRLSQVSDPKHMIKDHVGKKSKDKKEYKKLIKRFNFSSKTVDIIRAVKEYTYLRTYKKDVTTLGDFRMRSLLKEIGKRFGFSFDEIIYHSVGEICELLSDGSKLKKAIIKERFEDFAIIMDGKNEKVISGNDLKDYKQTWGEELVKKDVIEIQGEIASKGCGKGKVRVIVDRRLISSFQKGEVLVTTMTTPDFVPAMRKSVAIVTDEGGILCHAAIISRELGKPCIIGTEVATKILKTGDLVEVDAADGIVKILKQ